MSPTKWLPTCSQCKHLNNIPKCELYPVFFGVKLDQICALGTHVKIKACNTLLCWLAGLAWVAHAHILPQSASQLQSSAHLMSFVTESWLECGYISFYLPHENVSLNSCRVKHMYSSLGCSSLTIREDPGSCSSAIACKCFQYACSFTVWNNPCGVSLSR